MKAAIYARVGQQQNPLDDLCFPVYCSYVGCNAGPFTNGVEVDEHICEEHLTEAVWTFAEENIKSIR